MPLRTDEILALAPQATELANAITAAFGPDGDGGKKATPAELRLIGKKALDLGWRIIRDLID